MREQFLTTPPMTFLESVLSSCTLRAYSTSMSITNVVDATTTVSQRKFATAVLSSLVPDSIIHIQILFQYLVNVYVKFILKQMRKKHINSLVHFLKLAMTWCSNDCYCCFYSIRSFCSVLSVPLFKSHLLQLSRTVRLRTKVQLDFNFRLSLTRIL